MQHILLIEDNNEVRENTAEILELAGYQVSTAADGKKGVEQVQLQKPDLIICDIMMPVLDGHGALHLLSKNEDTASIPFIFLTAKAERSDFRKGMEMGADDYLTKPFNPKELFVRIKNLLDQRRLLREKFSEENYTETKSVTSNPLDEEFLQRAYNLVEKNLDNVNFDTEIFAKEMFLSRMQLHRKLQAITGKTPGDFMRTLRLKKAAQLLKGKKLSVTQIAFAVGYNSPSQFSRAFSKQFNCTPSEYLAQSKI